MYIEQFLQRFDDQHLANLQCACEDGRLVYRDPCNCLLYHCEGQYSVTKWEGPDAEQARQAEIEFFKLSGEYDESMRYPLAWATASDDDRRKALLPLIQAEWARRNEKSVHQINKMEEFTEASPAVR